MSSVQVTNIIIENNSTTFLSPIKMAISFDLLKEIKDGNFKFYISYFFPIKKIKF